MSEESNDNTKVDQITREPETPIIKTKDPKKVAAGKKLAEYHKKAKKALEIEKSRVNNEVIEEEAVEGGYSRWMPQLSFTTVLTVIGLGLTGLDLYFRFYKKTEAVTPVKKPSKMETNEVKDVKSQIPVRIGME